MVRELVINRLINCACQFRDTSSVNVRVTNFIFVEEFWPEFFAGLKALVAYLVLRRLELSFRYLRF